MFANFKNFIKDKISSIVTIKKKFDKIIIQTKQPCLTPRARAIQSILPAPAREGARVRLPPQTVPLYGTASGDKK